MEIEPLTKRQTYCFLQNMVPTENKTSMGYLPLIVFITGCFECFYCCLNWYIVKVNPFQLYTISQNTTLQELENPFLMKGEFFMTTQRQFVRFG